MRDESNSGVDGPAVTHPSSVHPHPSEFVDVVAAVVARPDGSFLLAQRPSGKVYAGWWEFPGGKVEPGEALTHALARELREELGIEVDLAYPWITRRFVYPHASVRLHFFRVLRWHGDPHGHEDQALAWQRVDGLSVAPMLPANAPVLSSLALPPVYALSAASELGVEEFLARLEPALARGLRLIQVREKHLGADELTAFARRVVQAARPYGARVLVNGDPGVARAAGAHGVHLSAARLMQAGTRPDMDLCGASCHTPGELARVAELELDFAVLGPVMRTPTHPGAELLGWQRFGEWVRDYPLPVFAIGGMDPGDLGTAWTHGGHGLAMLRGAWRS